MLKLILGLWFLLFVLLIIILIFIIFIFLEEGMIFNFYIFLLFYLIIMYLFLCMFNWKILFEKGELIKRLIFGFKRLYDFNDVRYKIM